MSEQLRCCRQTDRQTDSRAARAAAHDDSADTSQPRPRNTGPVHAVVTWSRQTEREREKSCFSTRSNTVLRASARAEPSGVFERVLCGYQRDAHLQKRCAAWLHHRGKCERDFFFLLFYIYFLHLVVEKKRTRKIDFEITKRWISKSANSTCICFQSQ